MSSQDSSSGAPLTLSQGGKRRRRSAPPPSRLSRPGSWTQSTQPTQSLSQPSNTKKKKKSSRGSSSSSTTTKNKRQRTLLESFNGKSQTSGRQHNQRNKDHNDTALLWVDQYAPTCRKELCVAPKKIQQVATWLEEEGREKLLILVGRPGIGKSAMVRVLAEETKTELLQWNHSYSTWSSHVESPSPLHSFEHFLQQSACGFASLELQLAARENASAYQQRVILLEELPNVATVESQHKLRQILTHHLQTSQIKTIWIYSEGTEGQSKPQDLERCIDPSVLYQQAKIVQINPATKSQVKKALERIAKAERFTVSKDFGERMHLLSGGDVRYAVMTLQFDQAGRQHQDDEPQQHSRDTQWSAFHALGKILYAKRETDGNNTSQNGEERPPLAFDPEQVLEQCDLDLGNALTYLGFHSPDFFTDVEELSTALDLFSDASYLLEQSTNYNYQRRNYNNNSNNTTIACPIFPEGYVTSLAGRSVAHANRHKAESRFRQLNAPKIFEIRRKRTDNAHRLNDLHHRMSRLALSGDLVSGSSSSHLPLFVMDRLPYLRVIAPDAVDATLGQLHTSKSEHGNAYMDGEDEAAVAARLEEEQNEILELDDIVDYDSSEEKEPAPVPSQEPKPQSTGSHNGSNSSLSGQPRENNENRHENGTQPAPTKMPVKRIANPYLKAKSSNPKPQQSTCNNVRQARAVPEVNWRRPAASTSMPRQNYVKKEPNASNQPHQAPEQTKPKQVGNLVFTDV